MRSSLVSLQWVALFLLASFFPANAETRVFSDIEIQSRIISHFSLSEPERTRFDKLEFVGGIELYSENEDFGGYSGFRFTKGRSEFISVSDFGFWLTGTIERQNGRPVSISNAHLAPIRDGNGKTVLGKASSDAEAIEIVGNNIYVTFERRHRVEIYNLDDSDFSEKSRALNVNVREFGLPGNKGLEAIASPPANSPLHGKLLMFSERALNKNGDIRAFIFGNGKLDKFSVARNKGFDITDGKFLPNGDLILLERQFDIANGAGIRLRRFKWDKIKSGARLVGEVLMVADISAQIDNFEGLDITKDEDGNTILTLISDDNHSILQRTLLLEFRLVD